jgi:hypothetical protein
VLWVLISVAIALCIALALACCIPVRVRIACLLHGTKFRCAIDVRVFAKQWRVTPRPLGRRTAMRGLTRSARKPPSRMARRLQQRAVGQVRAAGARAVTAVIGVLAAERPRITRSLHAVSCDRLSLRLSVGTGSAPSTAVVYGALCGAIGPTAEAVVAIWPPRRPLVFAVRPRFANACCQARLHCIAVTTPGKAILAAVRLSLVLWKAQRAVGRLAASKGDTHE